VVDLRAVRRGVAREPGARVIGEDWTRVEQLGKAARAVKPTNPHAALMLSDGLTKLLGNQSDHHRATHLHELGAFLIRLGEDYQERAAALSPTIIDSPQGGAPPARSPR